MCAYIVYMFHHFQRKPGFGQTSYHPRFRWGWPVPVRAIPVDPWLQLDFPMDVQWHFPTYLHFSVYFSKGLSLSQWRFAGHVQWIFSGTFQWSFMLVISESGVILCPEWSVPVHAIPVDRVITILLLIIIIIMIITYVYIYIYIAILITLTLDKPVITNQRVPVPVSVDRGYLKVI